MTTARNLFLALLFPVFAFGQTKSSGTIQDTSGKRPDFSKIVYTDIKWKKAEGNAFWFYYKPTLYFFKDDEFRTIPLESGDFLVYIFDLGKYVLLPAYSMAQKNVEHDIEIASNRDCVFIRLTRGRFWIFDKGIYVDNLERVGLNSIHQYLYRSGRTDKRYWIEESDFLYGPFGIAIGILSE